MDNLARRSHTSLRSWSRASAGDRHGVYGDVEPSKPMSKLDNARLKLSKFKLKYAKQERQEDRDSSSCIESEESSKTPLKDAKVETKDEERSSTGGSSTKSMSDDSLIVGLPDAESEKELENERISSASILTRSVELNLGHQQLTDTSSSDSSLSEISENVHSFSSLLKSEARHDSIQAIEKSKLLVPVPRVETASVLGRPETESNGSTCVSSISSELQDPQKNVHDASMLAAPAIGSLGPETRVTQSTGSEKSLHRNQQVIPETRISSPTVDSVSSKLETKVRQQIYFLFV